MRSEFLCFVLIISMVILINGVATKKSMKGSLIYAKGLEVQILRAMSLFQLTMFHAKGRIKLCRGG